MTSIDMAEPARCIFECPDHHGVSVHTVDCPTDLTRSACGSCREEALRQEIAADPYYSGDYYAMYGDDE